MTANENGPTDSYFEILLDEAVGPFFVTVGKGIDLVIDVPAADSVAELDSIVSVHTMLDALAGEETADVIADAYARRPISDLVDFVDDIREHFGILVAPDAGWAHLVEELNNYGVAIERELIDHRLNLYDWVRDHRNTPWNKLFRILSRPIDGGYYIGEVSSDIDRAKRMLEKEEKGELPKPSPRPSIIGWDSPRELLTEAVETLRRIEHATYAASPKFKGKGGKAPKNFLRPRTARDVAKELRSFADHDEIGAQVLGDRYKPILA